MEHVLIQEITQCAMEVHRTLGNGLAEIVYQRALAIELKEKGFSFGREDETHLFYKQQVVGTRRDDFVIDGRILVAVKAVDDLNEPHLAQVQNYLEVYQLPLGLIFNFGTQKLQRKNIFMRGATGLEEQQPIYQPG